MKLLMVSGDNTVLFADQRDDSSQFRDLLEYLSRHLQEIRVVAVSRRGRGKPWRQENLWVYPTRPVPKPLIPREVVVWGRKAFAAGHPDLITCQDPLLLGLGALWLQRISGAPLLLELHGDFLDNPHWLAKGMGYRLFNALGKRLLQRASLVRVTSEVIRRKALDWGLPAERLFYLPHRTDIRRFSPGSGGAELKARLGLDDRLVVLSVGRFAPEKDLPNLVRAFAELAAHLPTAHLVLVGDGPTLPQVEATIHNLGLGRRISLVGRVPNAKLTQYYRMADLFVLSSVFEGRPKVVQEALACGLPVVCTRVSGVEELVRSGETGYVVDIGDPTAMARAMLQVLTDTARRSEMAVAARSAMEADFTWERGMTEMLRMYRLAAGSA